jgi:hypothetical protein
MAEAKNFAASEGKGVIPGFMRLERQPRGFINELEYGGIGEKMKNLNARFQGRR